MKRKIIKQASQAYTITLPIEWIRKNNISEKSEVDLVVDQGTGEGLVVVEGREQLAGGA
jgi:phosphate uptake regulator